MREHNALILDECFRHAEQARKLAMSGLLRKPAVWMEQLIILQLGMVNVVCLIALLSMVVQFSLGWPARISQLFVSFAVLGVVPFNPWNLFFRNVFAERADLAFEEAKRRYLNESAFKTSA